MQGQKVGPSEEDDSSKTPKEVKGRESVLTKKESKKFKNKKSERKGPEKADCTKFEGEGITFKAKLIGLDDVEEARGDQLCQDTLHRLKAGVKTSGTHKTRITLSVSLDGIKIKDDKTGAILYHHPVHKISFISQDVSDSRAFGYIFSLSQTGHQFVGIKTEKMAAHVVIALRDLFQAVLELKKREIVEAETQQQITNSIHDGDRPACDETDNATELNSTEPIYSEVADRKDSISDLLDLRTELDQLQEGIAQMNDSIAASAVHVHHQILFPQKVEAHKENVTEIQENAVNVIPEEAPTDRYAVFAEIDAVPSLFDNPAIFPQVQLPDHVPEMPITKAENISTPPSESTLSNSPKTVDLSIFEELDPLGKGRPFISKEDFFRDIKTPPKKTLRDFPGGSESFDGPLETIPNVSLFNEETCASFPANPFGSPPRIPPRSPPNVDNWVQDPFFCEKIPCPPPPPLVSRSSEPNFPVIPSPPPRPSPRKCATPSPLRLSSGRPLPASPLSFRKLPSDEPVSSGISENHFTFDENDDVFATDKVAAFSKVEVIPGPFVSPFSPKHNTPVQSLESVSKSVSVSSDVLLAREAQNGTNPIENIMSPEERSIFRKTQDPFADDFFMSLAKSANSSGTHLCKNQEVNEPT